MNEAIKCMEDFDLDSTGNGNAKGYLIHVIHCVHVHFRLVANDNKK